MCAHGPDNRCQKQCFTCSEDEKLDQLYVELQNMSDEQLDNRIQELKDELGRAECEWLLRIESKRY